MNHLLIWLLERIAGRDLARDIAGDMVESGAGLSRLFGIFVVMTLRRAAEAGRHVRPRLGGTAADLRYAVRSLRRSPWYAATVIGVIALSMALAITVFAVVDGVLFKALPYPQSGRLVAIQPWVSARARPPQPLSASAVDVENWSAAAGAMITGFDINNRMITGGTARVADVQPNFFDTIGVRPLIGGLTSDDFTGDSEHAPLLAPAVISYDVWQRRFNGALDVVGRTLLDDVVKGSGYRVAGVMPQGFVFPSVRSDVQLITLRLPYVKLARDPRQRTLHEVIARLPDGVSGASLASRVESGMIATASGFPAPTPGRPVIAPYDRADIVPLDRVMGRQERPLFAAIFLAAVVLVSLGAVNVSGLMAARSLDRARELGLRRALGAGVAGIGRLVLTESFLLAAAGCAVGLVLAPSLLSFGLSMMPDGLSLLKTPGIDWRVAMFAVGASIALSVPTSIWPIRRALRARAGQFDGGQHMSEPRRSLGRQIVVTSQVAGAAILTIIGALLVGSFLTLYAHAPNIRTDDVVSVMGMFSGKWTASISEVAARRDAVAEKLRAMPGVSSVAAMWFQALRGGAVKGWFNPPVTASDPGVSVTVNGVTADFQRTVELQVVDGRFPTPEELARTEPVIAVSEGIARAYFSGIRAVGQTLTFGDDARPFRIVGVVKDVRWLGMDVDVANIYAPYDFTARGQAGLQMLVRVSGNMGGVRSGAGAAMESADPLIQTYGVTTMAERFSDSIRARRLQAWLFGAFAVSALAIVGVGIFGLTAMAMARRSREVGIRMALGSSRAGVVSALARDQLGAVMIGLVTGIIVTAWAVRFMAWVLYGVSAFDARVWSAAICAIVGIAALGALIPSLRASRIDPVKALRDS